MTKTLLNKFLVDIVSRDDKVDLILSTNPFWLIPINYGENNISVDLIISAPIYK